MLWSVKGGRHGEYEQLMLDKNLVLYDWPEFPDLRQFQTREDIEAIYLNKYPNASPQRRGNHVGQLWAFSHKMQAGDLVVVRMKTKGAIAIAEIKGPYEYRTDLAVNHAHPAVWLQTDLPPDRFGQDLRFSFGSLKTISRVSRNDAEARVHAIAQGQADPGLGVGAKGGPVPKGEPEAEDEAAIDLEEVARDRIRTFLSRNFTGHALARLVDGILKAQGYETLVSPPGPDGGVDILAGASPMGFGPLRLVVQVKSGNVMVDSGVLRELQGTMHNFTAPHGLLVSWAGFKESARKEAKQSYFSVRLWDQDDLITELLEHYNQLEDALRVDLPLKQVWMLATQDDTNEESK